MLELLSFSRKNVLMCAAVSLAGSSYCAGQSAITTPNAAVNANTLAVHTEMSVSSTVVQSLKKGDAVIVDFEIRTTEKWCSVRLAGRPAKLGFVQCQGLSRSQQVSDAGGRGNPSFEHLPGEVSVEAPGAPRRIKKLAVAPPPVRAASGYLEIQGLVVREDAIDIRKLAELEAAAKSGSPAAMNRAALGHYAAGNFERARNSPTEAMEQYETALKYSRDNNLLLANLLSLAYVHLTRSEYGAALGYLDRGRAVAPQSVILARMSGWAYYALDRLPEAVAEWKRAQQIQASPEIAAALERVEQDKDTEGEFREGQTSHFSMHYQGGATPQLATEILRTLEEHFRSLQTQMRFTPAESIAVVLYTQETFRDITRAPDWAGALNDGRIRVPVQGLSSVTEELSRILMHELTHSFVRQKTQGRCPQWLNEGLAQWMEGRRSSVSAGPLIAVYDRREYIPLHQLEDHWTGLGSQAAGYAYAWSLAATETIIAKSGMYGLDAFFEHFANDAAVEPALREGLQITYADLERNTADYLRRTYAQ